MTLEVVEATRIDRDVAPEEFSCEKQHLVIGVADGAVSLTRVRPPGKGEMQGCAFARGARLDTDSSWTCPS
jgi:methionyl-tRNA formyltransferase